MSGNHNLAGDESTGYSKRASFISVIKDYKELIAIVAFFIGGVFWILDYFATKQQLKELHCLMNANIDFMQGRIDAANLSQLMVQNFEETKALDKSTLSVEEKNRQDRLSHAAEEIGRKLAAAENTTAQALNRLRSGECVVP